MRKILFGTLIAASMAMVGCSDDEATNDKKAEEVVETVPAEEADVAEETTDEPAEAPEEPVEEAAPLTEEELEVFFGEYTDITNSYTDFKEIDVNLYQTMKRGDELDTFTTWKLAPGDSEPEKLFEKTFESPGTVSFPKKVMDIVSDFRKYDEFYVIEPLVAMDAETVAAIKDGYFPFSDIRLDMTPGEAAEIHPNPYNVEQYDTTTWYYGTDITYSVFNDSQKLQHIEASSEAFSDFHTIEELKTVFGEPTVSEPSIDTNETFFTFTSGEYAITVYKKDADEEWQRFQIEYAK